MSSPTVVLLAPGFPADEGDTACIPALQNYVLHASRARPDLPFAVIAFEYPPTPRTYRWHGIEVHAAGGDNRRGALRRLTWLRATAAFRRIRRRAEVAGYRVGGKTGTAQNAEGADNHGWFIGFAFNSKGEAVSAVCVMLENVPGSRSPSAEAARIAGLIMKAAAGQGGD